MTNEKITAKHRKGITTEVPVHIIHEGAVTASIWRRQSPSGYAYHDYSLSRTFESLSSKSQNSSRNFFAKHRNDLAKVISAATQWIVEREAVDLPLMAA